MPDSSPVKRDWTGGILLAGAGIILTVFLVMLGVTSHVKAAFWIIIALCSGSLIIRALLARGRD